MNVGNGKTYKRARGFILLRKKQNKTLIVEQPTRQKSSMVDIGAGKITYKQDDSGFTKKDPGNGESLPLPNPTMTDASSELEEPIYLMLRAGWNLKQDVTVSVP